MLSCPSCIRIDQSLVFVAVNALVRNRMVVIRLQVEIADCMQTLFRGNSLASKIMAYCFKIYGHGYLRELLNGLVTDMFIAAEKLGLSYEVDPARYLLLFV